MTLNLHTSNRLDILAGQLARIMAVPLASPLTPEVIVVQSRGMQRWLSLRLARSLGICANGAFPFPNAFFTQTVQASLPDLPDTEAFEREALAWRIMGLLPGIDMPSPRSYLQGDTGLKLYQLSCRMADLFDQYAIYRPEMLAAWENGKLCYENDGEETWQAQLWLGLVGQNLGAHRGRLLDDFLAAFKKDPALSRHIPERISVFGIAVLPPYHIRFFEALAEHCQVHLFLLNPCREYWGDIVTEKQASRLARRRGRPEAMPDEVLHLSRGNSLLAGLGAYGREFYELLLESPCQEHELFAEETGTSLLACIKDDILNLRDRGAAGDLKTTLAAADRSLQIHSCHSPMREVEVLHDTLLGLFEGAPDLAPHDILVMTPDLETYGPFVQAVFGAPESEALRIPFSMADRSFLHAYPLYEAVLHLLSLSQSRFGAPQVLQVLESRAVQQRFGLSEGDLELVRLWITKTRIRWGKDAASRSQDGLPACGENTWEAGLERLLLGYAMPGDEGALFEGVLPYGPMEGGAAQALGRFAQFMSVLFTLSDRLRGDKNLTGWSRLLQDMLADFFDPDSEDETHTLDTARQACAGLGRMQEISGFDRELSLEVVAEHLEKAFSQQVTGAGFLTGAVTVCAMLPMRSIPFKIICLLGMNDGLFPRVARSPAFDLIARHSRPCDRSVKKDDRYLFLETLLSAQQQLFISYTGQNMSDNSVIPPSTVVSQLLDYLDQGFTCPDPEKPLREYMITKHRLQPFSPGYFEGKDLRSYSLRDFHCAQAIRQGADAKMPPFFSGDLPTAEDAFKTLSLDDLCSFLVNPCRFILQKRLGIYFDATEDLIEDREPFALAGLERYTVEQELLERRLAGAGAEQLYPSVRAQGLLPHGMVGELVYDASVGKIDDFIEQIAPYRAHASAEPVALVLQVGEFTLTGALSAMHNRTLVVYRYAKAKPKDFLGAWIYHLALCASGTGDMTLLFALDARDTQPTGWRFPRIDDAETLLGNLLDLYWQGLHRPLPLFPKASFAFADKLLGKNGDEQKALQAALDAFEGSDFTGGGDADDPYINICFPDSEFDEREFMNLARSVYVTMMEHRVKPGEE